MRMPDVHETTAIVLSFYSGNVIRKIFTLMMFRLEQTLKYTCWQSR